MKNWKPTDYPLWFRLVVIATLLLLTVNLFFFLVPITAIVGKLSMTGKDLLVGLGTLVASFVGAWFAFQFANYQREREKVDQQIAAGNRALFTLTAMYNGLKQYQKEIIDPYRGKDDGWLNLHVTLPLNADLSFDMKDLSFVMETNAVAFQHVFLEEQRFRMAAYMVEYHRRVLVSDAWPRLTAAGIGLDERRPLRDIEMALDPATIRQLKVITAGLITNVDDDVKSSMDVFKELRAALKSIYPDRKFIDFNPN